MCIYILLMYISVSERVSSCVNVLFSHNPCTLLQFCMSNKYYVPFKHTATGLNRLAAVM